MLQTCIFLVICRKITPKILKSFVKRNLFHLFLLYLHHIILQVGSINSHRKKILNLLVWFHLPHLRLGIIQASLASALAARSVRFVIFSFLSGAYCQFYRSRCPHRSLKNWHSALRDKSKIWQSELIEPTFNEKLNFHLYESSVFRIHILWITSY